MAVKGSSAEDNWGFSWTIGDDLFTVVGQGGTLTPAGLDYAKLLFVNIILSVIAYALTLRLVPVFSKIFLESNLYGRDPNKRVERKIPEGLGVITGSIFMFCMVFFIPVVFIKACRGEKAEFGQSEFLQYLSALLSISCAMLFGFVDDVLRLRWYLKLSLPYMAVLPLLMVYYVTGGSTTVIVPLPLRFFLGNRMNIGFFYFLYMMILAQFFTNAIRNLSGINGLEAGESVVICLSVVLLNFVELSRTASIYHKFSLLFMFPFLATTMGLLRYSWFPASILVGRSFCYMAGMVFAVVASLGHFTRSMLFFFMPQILNMLFSLPQFLHIIPCPKSRLPKFNPNTGLVGVSKVRFKYTDLSSVGDEILHFLEMIRLVQIERDLMPDSEMYLDVTNCTLSNFLLKGFGPMEENNLAILQIVFQIFCSLLAFGIRYTSISSYVYGLACGSPAVVECTAGG